MPTAKQLANIKGHSFKKGQSGNPNGRPKLPSELRLDILKAIPDLNRVLIAKAKKGDTRAAKILYDKTMPNLQSVEYRDNSDKINEDLSGLTDDQLKQIEAKQAEIEAIKNGGKDSGHENPVS